MKRFALVEAALLVVRVTLILTSLGCATTRWDATRPAVQWKTTR